MVSLLTEEMVEAWLQKLDKVLEKTGKPTWSTLVAALKRIGHNGITAEIMEKEGSKGILEKLYNVMYSVVRTYIRVFIIM